MKPQADKTPQKPKKPDRGRWTAVGGIATIIVLITLGVVLSGGEDAEQSKLGPTAVVQRGPLTIDVTESGSIVPRKQVVIKNNLDDDASILYIVPEGQRVSKGELLVELDITELENEILERRIRVQNDEADLIHAQENLAVVTNQAMSDIEQAELDYKFAQQDLQKYLEGEYPKLLKEALTEITLSEEELTQAEQDLKWSKRLYEEKYLSLSELQQDELATTRASLNVELAQTNLFLLKEYTYKRQLEQLKSDVHQAEMALERTRRRAKANVAQAEAQLAAREAQLQEEKTRLEEQLKEKEYAKVYAPIDGMVIYATSVQDRWRRNDDPIEVGTTIRERDEIIYLPTADDFNANIKVTEVDLGKITKGLPVTIQVDSMPDKTFTGTVASIAQLPDQDSRYLNPNLKLYETVIEIDSEQVEMRNGMSCRASVLIEEYDDILYVPIQAVTRMDGRPTVYTIGENRQPVPKPVIIGLDNSRFVHIKEGVTEGETIMLTPPMNDSQSGEEETATESETPPAGDGRPGSDDDSESSNT